MPDLDIPVARRSTPRPTQRPPLLRRLVIVLASAAGLTLLLLAPEPLRRWLAPPPVPGLAERPGLDGRLLGHFPYAEAPQRELVSVDGAHRLQRDAADALDAMLRAAHADGVELVVLSGFRSIEEQKGLFFDVKSERNQSAQERARVSAPPGFSEHSTGYAVDLGDAADPATNVAESFERTRAFRWLQAHARRFHFTLSFPRDNHQGVSYEPWHWRFEGTADALKLFEPASRLAQP